MDSSASLLRSNPNYLYTPDYKIDIYELQNGVEYVFEVTAVSDKFSNNYNNNNDNYYNNEYKLGGGGGGGGSWSPSPSPSSYPSSTAKVKATPKAPYYPPPTPSYPPPQQQPVCMPIKPAAPTMLKADPGDQMVKLCWSAGDLFSCIDEWEVSRSE